MTALRLPRRHLLRVGLLLAWVVTALLAGAAPVRAASAVDLEARALLGGRYEVGGWVAVNVSLVNDGAPTDGHLVAESATGSVRRYVELPAGSRKSVTMYVQAGGFQREVTVRYEEPNGAVEAQVPVRVLAISSQQVAIVGDANGAIRPQLAGALLEEGAEPFPITPQDIPERHEPLAPVTTIIWAGDSGSVTTEQREVLERWVAEGGQLVVLGGADWQARSAGLASLLPLDDLRTVDGTELEPLAQWVGSPEAPLATASVSTGSLRDGARALVVSEAGEPLLTWHPVGAGRVVFVGADLAVDAFRGWSAGPALWARLLSANAALESFFGGGLPDREQTMISMGNALNTLPALEVPPAELLLAVIVAYILLIGPVSYLVLRRIDRRELAWVTAPALVLVFTGCSYGIGLTLKGTDVIVNQISIVRGTPGGSVAAVETYAGVFSPTRATFDLVVEADALVATMVAGGFGPETGVPRLVAEQGNPARLYELPIAAGGFQYVRADALLPHPTSLDVSWQRRGDELVATVTNVGTEALTDVAYISTWGGVMIGDLGAGESATFEVDRRRLGQSSASDQVYGFGGFDTSDPDRRRIAARRNVIDALVGYGGWRGISGEFTSIDRGPYLVGWRQAEGPMPVTLENSDAQRYAEVAEVVAADPGFGSGTVTIGPGDMHVSVRTEGNAINHGPGMVGLNGGSATFGIALPLEASGMDVRELEIVAGPDPMMVIEDPGGLVGFWPEGHVVEVRDPRTGQWRILGDLSETSRFTIDDPATAISPTGRIEVRATGAEANPNFGESSLYVSARVVGELAP